MKICLRDNLHLFIAPLFSRWFYNLYGGASFHIGQQLYKACQHGITIGKGGFNEPKLFYSGKFEISIKGLIK